MGYESDFLAEQIFTDLGLLSSIILVSFHSPVSHLFLHLLPFSLSLSSRTASLRPRSCAVHSSSRDSVLMSLGTPPVLDSARMVWLTAAISTAREMGSWCSLCAALSSCDREGDDTASPGVNKHQDTGILLLHVNYSPPVLYFPAKFLQAR